MCPVPARAGHRLGSRLFVRRIVIKDSLAGVALHYLAGAYFIEGLRAQHDLAAHTLLIASLSDAASSIFGNTIVVLEQVSTYSRPRFFTLGVPLSELLFVLYSALARGHFLFFDFSGFFFQFQFSGFYIFFASFGADHQLQNLVFIGADVTLGELNLVQQRFILLVGFYFERMVETFVVVPMQILDGNFVLATGGFVCFDVGDRKSTRLNSSHRCTSYAVF